MRTLFVICCLAVGLLFAAACGTHVGNPASSVPPPDHEANEPEPDPQPDAEPDPQPDVIPDAGGPEDVEEEDIDGDDDAGDVDDDDADVDDDADDVDEDVEIDAPDDAQDNTTPMSDVMG